MKNSKFNPVNDVLVAMIPTVSDFQLLKDEGWYRVRISKQTPVNLRDESARWMLFIFPQFLKTISFK